MTELMIEAPNPIAALGLVDRLASSRYDAQPADGEVCRIRVAASEHGLGPLLGVVHAWLDAYDLHAIELSIGTRRYTLGGSVAPLPGVRPADELPDEIVLES